jgi:pyrimidine operon attenuation protein/uracil phosphoribosyltransferase
MQILLSSQQLQLTIKRLAYQLMENQVDEKDTVIIGIQPRGVAVANKIVEIVQAMPEGKNIEYGILDITFYRDDIRDELHIPKPTTLPFSIEGKHVILVDDVLYTGRTIRAALDALQDFGRPRKVSLCVLVNRKFNRELPIQPDYCGITIDTSNTQKVKVNWEKEEAVLY